MRNAVIIMFTMYFEFLYIYIGLVKCNVLTLVGVIPPSRNNSYYYYAD